MPVALPYEGMRTFAEVARQGSFSRAGQALYRSQSAVSLQVAKLAILVASLASALAGIVILRSVESSDA